jgi:SH3-like domain-containing protein
VVITANATSAHQGPSSDSPAAFTLSAGKIVEAVVRAGDWVQVRDDQGQTGWVAAGATLKVE